MLITVKVHPRSKKSQIKKTSENSLEIWLHEPPVDGKANQKALEMIAEFFALPKSKVMLKSGQASKIKTFEVLGAVLIPGEQDLFSFKSSVFKPKAPHKGGA